MKNEVTLDERKKNLLKMLDETMGKTSDTFRFCIENPFVNGSLVEDNGRDSYK